MFIAKIYIFNHNFNLPSFIEWHFSVLYRNKHDYLCYKSLVWNWLWWMCDRKLSVLFNYYLQKHFDMSNIQTHQPFPNHMLFVRHSTDLMHHTNRWSYMALWRHFSKLNNFFLFLWNSSIVFWNFAYSLDPIIMNRTIKMSFWWCVQCLSG